ncbi:hypothetical protein RUM43_011088 [Polyplax serrata]|uniref:Uncharacterized protein n=1 Tax=Polyplax serrata TaxID=468196 RepID=A0AAN8S0T2_POLSC
MDRFSIQSVVEMRSQVRPQEKNQMEDNNTDIKETARIGGRQEGCQCRIGKSGHPVVNLLTTPSGGAKPSAGGEMSKLSEHQRPSSATSESPGVTSGGGGLKRKAFLDSGLFWQNVKTRKEFDGTSFLLGGERYKYLQKRLPNLTVDPSSRAIMEDLPYLKRRRRTALKVLGTVELKHAT